MADLADGQSLAGKLKHASRPFGAWFETQLSSTTQTALARYQGGNHLLFLQHMLSRMKDLQDGSGRVAIVMNGSPLFTGDAGSGESEIRRWILEND